MNSSCQSGYTCFRAYSFDPSYVSIFSCINCCTFQLWTNLQTVFFVFCVACSWICNLQVNTFKPEIAQTAVYFRGKDLVPFRLERHMSLCDFVYISLNIIHFSSHLSLSKISLKILKVWNGKVTESKSVFQLELSNGPTC